MNTPHHLRSVLVAVVAASSPLLLQPAAFAADSAKPTEPRSTIQTIDRNGKCKDYILAHSGTHGKGVAVVKVMYVERPQNSRHVLLHDSSPTICTAAAGRTR